jgi:hypothetical protein
MARFQKTVLKPGRYWVSTFDGKRKEESFSSERIKHFADQHKLMLASGLKVPAPWGHDTKSVPMTKKEFLSAKNNAGEWNFTLDDEGNLEGVIEVPLEEDAKRIGTTVKEVSPMIFKKFLDGNGRIWEDVIIHGALVTQAVQKGQENFKPVRTEDHIAVAMSCYMGEIGDDKDSNRLKEGGSGEPTDPAGQPKGGPYGVGDAVKCLRKVGVDLPDDTSEDNIVERIVVACRAIQGADDGDEEGTERGIRGGTEQPQPIAMDIDMDDKEKVTKLTNTLQKVAQESVKGGYVSRIKGLISSGRISKKYAQENLEPLIGGFQLSITEEGEIGASELETAIGLLEKLPTSSFLGDSKISTFGQKSEGSAMSLFEEELPPEYEGEELVTDQDGLDKIADIQLKTAGYKSK